MAQSISSQYLPLNAAGLAAVNHALDLNYLGVTANFDTDINTNAGGSGGVQGLINIIATHTIPPALGGPLTDQDGDTISGCKAIGTLSDSNVNGVTTFVGLVALFTTQDANLVAGYRASYALGPLPAYGH